MNRMAGELPLSLPPANGVACAEDADSRNCLQCEGFALRVSDGTRTRDHLDHNQELYLLSYAHRETA
jgi:hypothetical protein